MFEGIVYDDMKYKVKVFVVKFFVYIYCNILDCKDLFIVMFNIKLYKEKFDFLLK